MDHTNHLQDDFPVNQFHPPAEVLGILEKEEREIDVPKEANLNFRFSVGQLPNWAKAKVIARRFTYNQIFSSLVITSNLCMLSSIVFCGKHLKSVVQFSDICG